MKALYLLLLLSHFGNKTSDYGIPYRPLSWRDFKGPVPAEERGYAAKTVTVLVMETTERDDKTYYAVKAYFSPDSSYVRVKSDAALIHEQTHFKIAYIESIACMRELLPLQGKDSKKEAMEIYLRHVNASSALNKQYDQETDHSLNAAVERIWEEKITRKLHTLETQK